MARTFENDRLAKRIVKAVLADLASRHSLGQTWENYDKPIRNEIRQAWTEVVGIVLDKTIAPMREGNTHHD